MPITGIETIEFEDGSSATLEVVGDNVVPVAVADTATMDEDTSITILASDLLSNDADFNEDALTLTSVQDAVNGTVSLDVNNDVVFTPDADFTGEASFTYTIDDGNGGSSTATSTITVNNINDASVVTGSVTFTSIAEDSSFVLSESELLANASDVDGDVLSVVNLSSDSGTLVDNGDATWTFTPDADFNGDVTFSYDVDDGTVTTVATATVTVNCRK